MFNWVGTKFDAVLNTYVLNVVTSLIAGLVPLAIGVMTIWVLVHGWAVLRNEVVETVPTFLWKLFKISIVLLLSLNAGLFISQVADTANSLSLGVATTFLPS